MKDKGDLMTRVLIAIYDPAQPSPDGSYWIWRHAELPSATLDAFYYERASRFIPKEVNTLTPEDILGGVATLNEWLCLWRYYNGGRDLRGRPGRFVLTVAFVKYADTAGCDISSILKNDIFRWVSEHAPTNCPIPPPPALEDNCIFPLLRPDPVVVARVLKDKKIEFRGSEAVLNGIITGIALPGDWQWFCNIHSAGSESVVELTQIEKPLAATQGREKLEVTESFEIGGRRFQKSNSENEANNNSYSTTRVKPRLRSIRTALPRLVLLVLVGLVINRLYSSLTDVRRSNPSGENISVGQNKPGEPSGEINLKKQQSIDDFKSRTEQTIRKAMNESPIKKLRRDSVETREQIGDLTRNKPQVKKPQGEGQIPDKPDDIAFNFQEADSNDNIGQNDHSDTNSRPKTGEMKNQFQGSSSRNSFSAYRFPIIIGATWLMSLFVVYRLSSKRRR